MLSRLEVFMKYTFEVEGKVKAKQSTKFTKIGNFVRAYTPSDVKSYSNWVRLCFKGTYPDFKPLEDAVRLLIEVNFMIPKSYSKKKVQMIEEGCTCPTVKPDCDNICKQIADSLNGLAWIDDKQIVNLEVRKRFAKRDYVTISFEEWREESCC